MIIHCDDDFPDELLPGRCASSEDSRVSRPAQCVRSCHRPGEPRARKIPSERDTDGLRASSRWAVTPRVQIRHEPSVWGVFRPRRASLDCKTLVRGETTCSAGIHWCRQCRGVAASRTGAGSRRAGARRNPDRFGGGRAILGCERVVITATRSSDGVRAICSAHRSRFCSRKISNNARCATGPASCAMCQGCQ
jgi:hypothetical protein